MYNIPQLPIVPPVSSLTDSASFLTHQQGLQKMIQKIVIKLQVHRDKYMKKAMTLVASAEGVNSVAIRGTNRDHLVVFGIGIDSVDLVTMLRRKVAQADIVSVGGEESDEDDSEDEEPRVDRRMQWNPFYTPLNTSYAPSPYVIIEKPHDSHQDSCSVM